MKILDIKPLLHRLWFYYCEMWRISLYYYWCWELREGRSLFNCASVSAYSCELKETDTYKTRKLGQTHRCSLLTYITIPSLNSSSLSIHLLSFIILVSISLIFPLRRVWCFVRRVGRRAAGGREVNKDKELFSDSHVLCGDAFLFVFTMVLQRQPPSEDLRDATCLFIYPFFLSF